MSDRFRKFMDKRAGRGGVKCYCCEGKYLRKRSVRTEMNREARDEIDEYFKDDEQHQEMKRITKLMSDSFAKSMNEEIAKALGKKIG